MLTWKKNLLFYNMLEAALAIGDGNDSSYFLKSFKCMRAYKALHAMMVGVGGFLPEGRRSREVAWGDA
jgi:hypothetical protein